MFNLTDQLAGSFEELMEEIRGMRGELERIRAALEAQAAGAQVPAAGHARRRVSATSAARSRKTAAA
jgi:hypothetical protein